MKKLFLSVFLVGVTALGVFGQEAEVVSENVLMRDGTFWPQHETVGKFYVFDGWADKQFSGLEDVQSFVAGRPSSYEENMALLLANLGAGPGMTIDTLAQAWGMPDGETLAMAISNVSLAEWVGQYSHTKRDLTDLRLYEVSSMLGEIDGPTALSVLDAHSDSPSNHTEKFGSQALVDFHNSVVAAVKDNQLVTWSEQEKQDVMWRLARNHNFINTGPQSSRDLFLSQLDYSELDFTGQDLGGMRILNNTVTLDQISAANRTALHFTNFSGSGITAQDLLSAGWTSSQISPATF